MTLQNPARAAALAAVLAAFALGLVVHAATYFGVDPRGPWPGPWAALQLTSVLALVPGALYYSRRGEGGPGPPPDRLGVVLVAAFGLFAFYAVFNFMFTLLVLNEGASPEAVGGRYYLMTHGVVVRELDGQGFVRHKVYEAREQSGHWMLFYTVAAAALLEGVKRATPRRSPDS
jgi:hypothetical protein